MKRFLTVCVAGLLVVALCAPAFAWEILMTGEWEQRVKYITRTGGTDLFGIAALQDSALGFVGKTGVGLAGPNWYNRSPLATLITDTAAAGAISVTNAGLISTITATSGGGVATSAFGLAAAGVTSTVSASGITVVPVSAVSAGFADTANGRARIVRGGYSTYGCDALWQDTRLTLTPTIRVNDAIRVHGVYTVGGYRHKYFQGAIGGAGGGFGIGQGTPPLERAYMQQDSMNAYDTMALGSWEQMRATIQVPWGIISIGAKDFPLGTGATLGYNTRSEAFLLVLPYGPMRFLAGWWIARGPVGAIQESWRTSPDKDTKNQAFGGLIVTYDQGPLNLGGFGIIQLAHVYRGELLRAGLPVASAQDVAAGIYGAFFKFNNGRFFAAAEYTWATIDGTFVPFGIPGGFGVVGSTGRPPSNAEAYHWFSEIGAVAGPAKVRLMYSIASGPVLNNGPALVGGPQKNYRPWPINYQAMQPYEFLMFNTYAGGNNGGWNTTDLTFVSDDHGMMEDAFCFAGRGDYAIASNLNVWGSYIWAHRLEKAGFLKGGYDSFGGTVVAGPGAVGATYSVAPGLVLTTPSHAAWVATNFGGASGLFGGTINPYVDDGFIGWEANLGMDWKLLEGLNFFLRYSYWQPGKWFEQAYQSVGMVGGAPSIGALVKGRDAIQAMQGSFLITF